MQHVTSVMARPSLLYDLSSILQRIELTKVFPKTQPVEVELGSGDGSFLAEYAAQHPEHNFIGVERLLGPIQQMDRKGLHLGFTNLLRVRIGSSYFLLYPLPAN